MLLKPKPIFTLLSLVCETFEEPLTVQDALSDPKWKQAMIDEFQALVKNDTWQIVPLTSDMNIMANKWMFLLKEHVRVC